MWSGQWFGLVVAIVLLINLTLCYPVSNSFNSNIRSYSVKEEDRNSTARTLQQEDLGRYANFAPVSNPIQFKEEVPDNALSESTYGRGLHHDHGGYGLHGGLHEYGDGHYGYDYDHHGFNHIPGYHGHHVGLGHGLHHKFYDPALAAKAILWPLAGLAILGTAAALVSNPVLLQLGVISGRRRRDTQEITGPDYDFDKWKRDVANDDDDKMNFKIDTKNNLHTISRKESLTKGDLKKRVNKDRILSKKAHQAAKLTVESVTLAAPEYNGHSNDEDRFVPIHLQVKRH